MHVFYTPELRLPEFEMNENESNHAIRVLRLAENDEIHLLDGKGGLYLASILKPSKKGCIVRVKDKIVQDEAPVYNLHLLVAPTKNMDRFQFLVEKAVEIGVSRISPILCDHSERKVLKKEKVESTAIAAAKQSVTRFIPQIDELLPLKHYFDQDFTEDVFFAHCAEDSDKKPLKELYTGSTNLAIFIGPEGDFSTEEINEARMKHYKTISLSKNRLRTETAAIVACHTINLLHS